MNELGGAGLLAEAGLEKAGDDGFAVAAARNFAGDGWVETVENQEVALGIIESGKGGDPLQVVHGGEGFHLVVVDLVPGDVPAGMVGLDADGKVHGAEVVADGGKAGHEGELGAADREDERVVGGIGGDDAADLGGGASEGVVGGADVVEGLAGVGNGEHCEGGRDGSWWRCGAARFGWHRECLGLDSLGRRRRRGQGA